MDRMKPENRTYGRGSKSESMQGAVTHRIKIGRNVNRTKPVKGKSWMPRPVKMNGFLITADNYDESDRNFPPAWNIMGTVFGVTPEMVSECEAKQLQAPKHLPDTLHFLITTDAVKYERGASWRYPDLMRERRECAHGGGDHPAAAKGFMFCVGDGENAERIQPDISRKKIQCNPIGKPAVSAQNACPYSVNKKCKAQHRIVLCLIRYDAKGRMWPLDRAIGYAARYRFDSTGGWNPVSIFDELDRAADVLGGRLSGIRGVFLFGVKNKPDGKGGTNACQGVRILLNPQDIAAKYDKIMRERQLVIEEKRAAAGFLDAPKPMQETTEVEYEPIAEEPTYDTDGGFAECADDESAADFSQDSTIEPAPAEVFEPEPSPDEFAEPTDDPAGTPIEAIKPRTGTKNGNDWRSMSAKIDGEWYSTLSGTDSETIQCAYDGKLPVKFTFTTNGNFKNLESISIIGESSASQSPAPEPSRKKLKTSAELKKEISNLSETIGVGIAAICEHTGRDFEECLKDVSVIEGSKPLKSMSVLTDVADHLLENALSYAKKLEAKITRLKKDLEIK